MLRIFRSCLWHISPPLPFRLLVPHHPAIQPFRRPVKEIRPAFVLPPLDVRIGVVALVLLYLHTEHAAESRQQLLDARFPSVDELHLVQTVNQFHQLGRASRPLHRCGFVLPLVCLFASVKGSASMQPYLIIFQYLAHERQRLSHIHAAAGVRLLHGIVILQFRFRIAQCENSPADTFRFLAQGYDCGREPLYAVPSPVEPVLSIRRKKSVSVNMRCSIFLFGLCYCTWLQIPRSLCT